MVRLNGSIGEIFKDWIHKAFPDAADKVLNQIAEVHGGQLNDSRPGVRMRGEGNIADGINALFKASVKKHLYGRRSYELDKTIFTRPTDVKGQFSLF